jgi:hydrogenase maturation protease
VTGDGAAGERGVKRASRETACPAHIRVIGIGNEWRGDDAVGLLAARRLRGQGGSRAQVIEAETAGVELLDMMKGADTVLLIDAMCSGQAPGTILRLDASDGPIATHLFPRSTHAIGVGEALELARTLGILPNKVIVYGIEAGDTDIGHPLSPQVDHALNEVLQLVLLEAEASECTNSI